MGPETAHARQGRSRRALVHRLATGAVASVVLAPLLLYAAPAGASTHPRALRAISEQPVLAAPSVSTTAETFPASGGTFVVKIADLGVASTCVFAAGNGVTNYSGSHACGPRLFAHAGRVLPNTTVVTRRWTVRVTVIRGTATHRYAWVISVAGSPPQAPTPTVPLADQSSNWSGYVLATTPGSVNEVGATWQVPSLACAKTPNGQDAEWVGVDGASGQANDGLFQAGIASSCQGTQQSSFAWYEELPAAAQPIFVVFAGDTITAQVSQLSPGTWQYELTDVTTGQSASQAFAYSGPGASAEWIEEDPATSGQFGALQLAPYADYGSVRFTGVTANGMAPALDLAGDGVELVQGGVVLSVPSAPIGDGFTVSYQ